MRHSVQRAASQANGTRLTLDDGRALQFGVLPDPAGTPRVRAALRRITHVDVSVDPDGVRSTVRGIGHRRQCTLPVSVETALALAVEGCPCSVQFSEAAETGFQSFDEVRPA